ncbi:MAG: response regulator [Magnetococcales bacterium]|nr:response regulator [Magnetococcales bacterium]
MNRRKILVVDDREDIRSMLRTYLELWGYEVVDAENGRGALVSVDAEAPDMMILDHHMPDMSGHTVIKVLREEGSKIPVVMLTADQNQGLAVECFRAGANDFLAKPFDPDYLEVVIRRTLDLQEETERRQQAETALQAEKLSHDLKIRFLSNIGHHTATPLHQAMNYLSMAMDDLSKGEKGGAIRNMNEVESSLQDLDRLVSRISKLSRLEAKEVEYQSARVSLAHVISTVFEGVQGVAKSEGVECVIAQKSVEGADVDIDYQYTSEAVIELVEYAARCSVVESSIVLSISESEASWQILIQAPGMDLPESERSLFFSIFGDHEGDGANKEIAGKGLELSIAYRVITDQGGAISLLANSDSGVTFTLAFPKLGRVLN